MSTSPLTFPQHVAWSLSLDNLLNSASVMFSTLCTSLSAADRSKAPDANSVDALLTAGCKVQSMIEALGGFKPDVMMLHEWDGSVLAKHVYENFNRDGGCQCVAVDVTSLECDSPLMSAPWDVRGTLSHPVNEGSLDQSWWEVDYTARLLFVHRGPVRRVGIYEIEWH